ncbi:S8 family peptidase [Deinococcus roseus]|uniref:Peptidase S8/S53 domain-containing protein n=1 Tax=Deinococcus roseus TaxID=392414 RepID=A0ABQ2DDP8_9DEIO|nr:S8 family serine peptidase [Deinococcus roseus]GGJ53296.1 hypothetical protein GCM10008938_44140 [Deinococcus roseus]
MKHWWLVFSLLFVGCATHTPTAQTSTNQTLAMQPVQDISQISAQASLPFKLSSDWAEPGENLMGSIDATTPTEGNYTVQFMNRQNNKFTYRSTGRWAGSGKIVFPVPQDIFGGNWTAYLYYGGNYYLSELNITGRDTNNEYMMLFPPGTDMARISERLRQLGYGVNQILDMTKYNADLGKGSLCTGNIVVVKSGRPAGITVNHLRQNFPESEGHVDPKTVPDLAATYPQHLIDVNAPAAFDRGLDGSGIEIAVLDTGVTPQGELSLLPGYDFVSFDSSPKDEFFAPTGHGTIVAKVAAGKSSGVARGASIRPVRVCDTDGTCSMEKVFIGTCWALKNAVDRRKLVLNLSLGSETPEPIFASLFKEANSYGTLIAVSGGNQGLEGSIPQFPAGFAPVVSGMMSVAGVNGNNPNADSTRANYNSIAAPFSFRLPNINGTVVSYQGTSFSSPMVAGGMALWRKKNPQWSPAEIVKDMKAKARVPSGWVSGYGVGILDFKVAP